jgi:Zn-dependent protease with chaperone function
MSRHGPHILGLGKGLILFTAMLLFMHSGLAGQLITALQNHLYAWPMSVYPAFWFIVMIACLLLVFPITLAQDHINRAADGHHEEMPTTFWLRGLSFEILLGTSMGSIVSAVMYVQPSTWWAYISAGWVLYYFLPPRIHSLFVSREQPEKNSRAALLETLQEPLKQIGVELSDVYTIDGESEDEEEWLDRDMVFVPDGKRKALYVPSIWANTWTAPEITAVALHKHYLDRTSVVSADFLITTISSVICFGGFAWSLPWLSEHVLREDLVPLTTCALLVPWSLGVLFITGLPAQMIHRNWIYHADAFVARHMQTPDGLVAALERAAKNIMIESDPPRWAEVLFHSNPSLRLRIQKLHRQHDSGGK